MVTDSIFRNILDFFTTLGVYDVILPFLLVFSITFAILEKTMVLGYDIVGKDKFSKRNLDSMVAFVTAFLVIASSKLVAIINTAVSHFFLLLLLVVLFFILAGSFIQKDANGNFLPNSWIPYFMGLMAIGIILIFMDALDWLLPLWNYIRGNWQGDVVGSIVLMILIVLFMYWVTGNKKIGKEKEDNE